MISNADTGMGFKGCKEYLLHGHLDDMNPDRVDWIESRNLATYDPDIAVPIMRATANLSTRCKKPLYHMSISWPPNYHPAQDEMSMVADDTLEHLGLSDHQVLIIAHNDTDHAHMHLMINRVHPDTGKAWSDSWDYRRREEAGR